MRRLLKSLAAAVVLSIGLSGAAFATSYDCDGGSKIKQQFFCKF
jgi:hypothetical protein